MRRFLTLTLLLLAALAAGAQTDSMQSYTFAGKWGAQVAKARASQPGWVGPLAAENLKLNQGIRFDAVRETMPTGKRAWYIGNPWSVNTILWGKTELTFVAPERVQNNNPALKDGAGDLTLVGKFRVLSANEERGNYIVTTWAVVTLPTGSYGNGSTNGSVQPGVGAGKGFGEFDVQSTVSATLPTGNPAIASSGRPIAWNLVAHYRIARIIVPEIENNATFYKGGSTDGAVQNFVTPGLWISKVRLQPHNPASAAALSVGAGMQIATSHFATSNHGLILSARMMF